MWNHPNKPSAFKLAFLLYVSICLWNCDKNPETVIVDIQVDSFSEDTYRRFEPNFSVNNFLLNDDNSLTVVGHGPNPRLPSSCIAGIDFLNRLSWIEFIELDYRYSNIDLTPTENQSFMMITSFNPPGSDLTNMHLIKTSLMGEVRWAQTIGDPMLFETGESIIRLPDGDYILASTFRNQSSVIHSSQIAITRTAPHGEVIWKKAVSGDRAYFARDLDFSTRDPEALILLSEAISPNGSVRIQEIDFEGTIIRERTIDVPGDYWSRTSNIIQTHDGGLLLTFSADDKVETKGTDVFLVKLDEEINEEWRNTYGGRDTELSDAILQTADHQFLLLSSTSSFGRGGFDLMLTKIDETGEIRWAKTFGSSSSDQGQGLAERPNGNLIVLGNTNHNNNTEAIFSLILLETDAEGNPR